MLRFTTTDLVSIAEQILALDPDPIPRFRLLRDVLRLNPASPEYTQAAATVQETAIVKLLRSSQHPDGTWGRFHTQDTSVKQPFLATEGAIAVALSSGLDRHDPILVRVQAAILDYMHARTCWPDPPEKHDNPLAWYVWVPHVSAAVLSLIDRFHPSLEPFWRIWVAAEQAAFQSGSYDRQKEITALVDLLDCRMKNPIPVTSKYPLLLLSSTHNPLPDGLERHLLSFILTYPRCIYYTYEKSLQDMPSIQDRHFWSWTQAHALLSRFGLWKEMAVEALNWIWEQRNEQGFWDLGRKMARRPFTPFPLSESWRRPENRLIDYTVEMLTLLSSGVEDGY
jgi:hypothetical protein